MPHTAHNHTHCSAKALDHARDICSRHNVRFTPLRQRIVELLWENHKAVKAYDLLERLRAEHEAAKPPTVYRTLDVLQEVGLVHKVESMNAYIGCTHPDEKHHCQFLICNACGTVEESCDETILNHIRAHAIHYGFSVTTQTLELHGLCKDCQLE